MNVVLTISMDKDKYAPIFSRYRMLFLIPITFREHANAYRPQSRTPHWKVRGIQWMLRDIIAKSCSFFNFIQAQKKTKLKVATNPSEGESRGHRCGRHGRCGCDPPTGSSWRRGSSHRRE